MSTETTVPAVQNGRQRLSPLVVMGNRFAIEPARLLETLRGTVIKPDKNGKTASNEEVAAFVIVANQYQLNPFTREIHAFVGKGGGLVPIVGIDGWIKLVNQHPTYDGVEFEEESDAKGRPVRTTCIMHTKTRLHPVRVSEWYSECHRNTDPWNTMPRRMLRHKAYIQAARICFGFAGIVDEDEGADITEQRREMTALPQGRTSLKRVQAEAVPPVEVYQEDPFTNEPARQLDEDPPTTQDPPSGQAVPDDVPEGGSLADTISDLSDKIEAAGTEPEWKALHEEMTARKPELGEAFKELSTLLQARATKVRGAGKAARR